MSIISKITIGGKLVLEVNADPSINATPAPIGSKALFNDAGTGKEYLKVSASDTSWQMVVSGAIDLSPYFKKDGSIPMSGDILPDATGTRKLGDATAYKAFSRMSAYRFGGPGVCLTTTITTTVGSTAVVLPAGLVGVLASCHSLYSFPALANGALLTAYNPATGDGTISVAASASVTNAVAQMSFDMTVRTENETGADKVSGTTIVKTGNSSGSNGGSGNLLLQTGSAAYRGAIVLSAAHLNMNGIQAKNAADAVDPQDLVALHQVEEGFEELQVQLDNLDLSPYFKKDGSVPMVGNIMPDGDRWIGSQASPFQFIHNTYYRVDFGTLNYGGIGRSGNDISIDAAIENANIVLSPNGTGYVSVSSKEVKDLAAPTSASSATNKSYVDNADALLIPLAQKGAVNGVAPLDGAQKIPSIYLPALAITDTFVVASEVAMLALALAEKGDVAVRTDLNKSFILAGADPSILADWQELLTPTDTVLSVNGQIGAVILTSTHIDEGTNLYFTDPRAVSAAIASEKLWLVGDSASELNTASAVKFFGTKAGNFNVEFHRNSVKMFQLNSNEVLFNKNISLVGSGGNDTIQSSDGLNLSANGIMNITSLTRLYVTAPQVRTRLGGTTKLTEIQNATFTAVADANATASLQVSSITAGRNRMFKLYIYAQALNGASQADMMMIKTVHIGRNDAVVMVQDDFTSKNSFASAMDASVSNAGQTLTVDFSGLAGLTAKEVKMKVREITEE